MEILVFLLILIISVWQMATIKQDMTYMANELLEVATVNGKVGSEVEARYEELCSEIGFRPSVSFSADYFESSTGKVQLGDTITVVLSTEMTLPGFGGFELPFNVEVSKSGLSRIYWK